MFEQILANSLIAGAIYALVAVGFALIYSTCKFVHFAHGSVIAFSAYILFFLFSSLHINFWFAVVLSLIFAVLLGMLLNFAIYEPLRKRKANGIILLIASFALLILIESILLILFGADVKAIKFIKIARGWDILGAIVTPLQLVIIGVSIALLVGLFFFMKKTRIGKAMRAVSDNKDVAEVVGISSTKIYYWAFAIGSLIAGVAGILVGLEQNLETTMGTTLMIKGFTGAVIGSISSVPGAVLGSFLLGIVENFGIWFLPSSYKDAIAFVLLFIFLLFKPEGILGIKRALKK